MWIYYSVILFLIMIGIDQGTKIWITDNVKVLSMQNVIPNVISFTNVKNSGAAWSMLPGNRWLFVLIGIVALIVGGYYLWKCRFDFAYETGITLFLAGASGNLLSRITQGSVTDMIQTDFINFPVFNVADSSLTIGVILLMLLIGFNKRLKKRG